MRFAHIIFRQPLFEEPNDGGSGTTEKPKTGDGLTTAILLAPDVFDGFRSGVRREGGLQRFAETLFNENKDEREKVRQKETEIARLTRELGDARTKITSGSGLTTEDADELKAYRALGKVAEVKTKLDERGTLEARLREHDRKQNLRAAAKAEGYDPEAVEQILTGGRYAVEEVEVEKDGAKVKKQVGYYVDGEGDAATKKPLSEFLKERYSRIEESLRATNEQGASKQQQNGGGKTPPKQQAASGASGTNEKRVGQTYMGKRYTGPKKAEKE